MFVRCLNTDALRPLSLQPLYRDNLHYEFSLGPGQNRRGFMLMCDFKNDLTLMDPNRQIQAKAQER